MHELSQLAWRLREVFGAEQLGNRLRGPMVVSFNWNSFPWPLVVMNFVESRPLTVGSQIFASADQDVHWSVIATTTLLSVGSPLVAFVLFQRQFVQSFLRAGIR